ncbi:MAG: 1-acyl-sn-glycerol-3-phosphate acyltransferase [Candidatus Saccharimonadales bacterium]
MVLDRWMSRPKVSAENQPAVNGFYREHIPNQFLARIGYWGMSKVVRVEAHYAGDAKAQISEMWQYNPHVILINNHTENMDAITVAGAAHSLPPLRRMRGKTDILAKHDIFENPFQRRGVDVMGAIPTFRDGSPEDITNLMAYRMNKFGRYLAMDAEGKRNQGDTRQLLQFKYGVGYIACQLSNDRPLVTLPAAISYGEGDNKDLHHAVMCFSEPVIGHPTDPIAYVERAQAEVQKNLDWAFGFTDLRAAA